MKNLKNEQAVTEIIGTIFLLGITIVAFTVIYSNVLSDDGPSPEIDVTILGKQEDGKVFFEHRSGESLGLGTKVILSLGGKQYPMIIEDDSLLNDEGKMDGFWNIGETLVYSGFNTSNLQVEATIIDQETKSIVLWGILQEGIFATSDGGIWHFNENLGSTAHDSYGFDNVGYIMPDSVIGPRWTSVDKYNGLSALRFDGINDYVSVDGDSVFLDITDKLTVEAWMKIPKRFILQDYTFAPDFGYMPKIIQISENVYGVVYRGQEEPENPEKKWGVLKTIEIFEDGSISFDIYNGSLVFWDATNVSIDWPEIIHVYDDIYLIAYHVDPQGFGYFNTVEIAENGTITKPYIGSLQFGNSKEVYEQDIIHINENISAVIYRNNDGNGTIKTLEIKDNGHTIEFLDPATGGMFVFDNYNCYEPDITNIAGNTYAITYRDDNDYGVLATIEISDDGTITQQFNDTFSFDLLNKSYNPQLFRISKNIFGIIYYDDQPAGDGFITTIEISYDGIISNQVNDTSKFEDDYCIAPYITYLYDDFYSIAYQSSSDNDGALTTIEIDSNGTIFDNNPKKLIFTDADRKYFAQQCHLTHVSGDIVAIVFSSGAHSGQPHQGHLITFNAHADDDPNNPPPPSGNDPYDSGIYKEGAYGIFLNSKYLGASIGNDFFLKQINISSDWQHIVLTFDGYNVKVYLNGIEEISGTSGDGITSDPTKDILFGKSFFGYIDEVAILNRVLTSSEIINWAPRTQ